MTGRELILYILKNHLEDEPVFNDGLFVGFVPVDVAAAKLGVGSATITALVTQGELDHIVIGGKIYISDINPIKMKGE